MRGTQLGDTLDALGDVHGATEMDEARSASDIIDV